jgi:hypothetical protein
MSSTLSFFVISYTDLNGAVHTAKEFDKSEGQLSRTKARRCFGCKEKGKANSGRLTRFFCIKCGEAYCWPTSKNGFQDCFKSHVEAYNRTPTPGGSCG